MASRAITDLITGTVGGEITAPVRFVYDTGDPFTVLMDCTDLARACDRYCGRAVETDARTWVFARSLLTDAIVVDGRFGRGDVVVERAGAWVAITLTNPDGEAIVRFTHMALLRFVQRTAALVPLGRESEHQAAAIDDAIARLLGSVR